MGWLKAVDTQFVVVWCGVISTLAMYSILYKENRVFRLFEHWFIGLAVGYGLGQTWIQVLAPKWFRPIAVEGRWWWVFALLWAGMYYLVYSRKYNWIYRMAIGISFGIAAGYGLKGFVTANTPQIYSSFKPPFLATAPYFSFSNLVFLVSIVSVIVYFFFSVEHRLAAVRQTSQLGRWFIMIYLGAIFGTTVMGRMSLLIQRLLFVLRDALHVVK
jgi:hypothetical protein